ncbi:MAG: tetratricopeptide repeat protein [Cyclobacteriaceae bacterium]|nr:tetratricopeptide repeat protein [Cyclobacteriaceae bacterium]
MNITQRTFLFPALITVALLYSCSSEKNAPLNRAYHNTTAHYNAYFYALAQITSIEEGIKASQSADYDHILPIFPAIDSANKKIYKVEIEEAIKKASIVIQYHKNSKWVDDSYNIIGQARMYGYDYPNAIETFKYVNTKAEDINAKHWALINLMRTFIENNEMSNAEAVSDFLSRERLNEKNLKYSYLMKAFYYQKLDQKDNMVKSLVAADPLLTKQERAKLFFIIGQVYQKIGFESSAFDYYKKCIRSNPEYELSFYAKLNMAQVTQLGERSDIKDVRKYFKKLVKDEKNREFQDRIYYEWAKFELKQGYLPESLINFNLSIQTSKNNPRIKGLAYLSLGEVYFDTLKNYSTAQAYYDSAVTTLPKNYEFYEKIATRNEVLTRFIKQINTITLQDSLLTLSTKDSTELMALFTAEAEQRRALEKAKEEKQRKKDAAESFFSFNQEPTGIGGGNWYFTNPAAVSKGRIAFKNIWGERALEDHWRRSIKSSVIETDNESSIEEDSESSASELDDKNSINNVASGFYNQVPKTKQEVADANKKLEDAFYNLGNIYHFELEEDNSAIENYNILLNRYPKTLYEPEVLYLLYLIEMEENPDKSTEYKNLIFDKYPNSLYANLILNPQFVEESDKANEKLAVEYKKAYTLYKAADYESAKHYINTAIKEYPKASFISNFWLLKALITGKTEPLPEYQLALNDFIIMFPEGELNEYAKKLLEASKTYQNRLVKLKETRFSKVVADQDHYFILITDSLSDKTATETVNRIINSQFANKNFTVGKLNLDTKNSFLVIKTFADKDGALLFYDIIKSEQSIKNVIFVISKLNFELLHQTKEVDTYLTFFEANY